MALTRESLLFGVDYKYGVEPIIGSDPAYIRDTAAHWFDGRAIRDSITGPGGLAAPRLGRVWDGEQFRQGYLGEPGATKRNSAAPSVIAAESSNWAVEVVDAAQEWYRIVALVDAPPFSNTYPVTWAGHSVGAGVSVTFSAGMMGRTKSALILAASGFGSIEVNTDATGRLWRTITHGSAWTHTPAIMVQEAARAGIVAGDFIEVRAMQLEVSAFPSSPIIGGSGTVRAADNLSYPNPPRPQAMVGYSELIWGMPGVAGISSPRMVQIGDPDNTNPRLILYQSNDTNTDAFYNGGAGTTIRTVGLSPVVGSRLRLAYTLSGTGELRLVGRKDDGAAIDAGVVAGDALPASWGDEARFSIGNRGVGSTSISRAHHLRHHIVRYADVETDPLTGTAADLLAELDAFDPGPP